MINNFCKKILSYLLERQILKKEDSELYEYSLKIFLQSIISILATTIIGIVFGMFKEYICFILVFIVLRKFTGGLHAKKYIYCLFSSIILTIVSLSAIKLLQNNDYKSVFIFFTVTFLLTIIILSPIESENKPLTSKEKKIYKFIVCIMSLIIQLCAVILIKWHPDITYSLGTGIIAVGIFVVLALLRKLYTSAKKNGKNDLQ